MLWSKIKNHEIHGCKIELTQSQSPLTTIDHEKQNRCLIADRLFSFQDIESDLCSQLILLMLHWTNHHILIHLKILWKLKNMGMIFVTVK